MIEVCAGSEDNFNYQMTQLENDPGYTAQTSKKSLFNLSYRDYCLIWMLITVQEDAMLARLQNLVQMETLYYYTQKKASFTFDLRDSFTYLDATVKVDINQVMPSLLDSALFTVERQQYRGY